MQVLLIYVCKKMKFFSKLFLIYFLIYLILTNCDIIDETKLRHETQIKLKQIRDEYKNLKSENQRYKSVSFRRI